MLVAGERQLRAQRVDVERRAVLEKERERGEIGGRSEAIQRRRRGDDQDVAFAARHPVERREAFRDEVVVRRELVVGERLPVGEQCNADAGGEPRNLVGESLRRERVGADDGEQALFARGGDCELRQPERVGGPGEGDRANFLARRGQIRRERGQRGEHRDGRGDVGSRGRGGSAASCVIGRIRGADR